MRIRNLNPKPTTFTGNPLMRIRWNSIYRNGDGCFTVNSGNNKRNGLDADFIRATTSFDIIANYDTGIPGADVAPWITGLPDGQVCFLCDVEPLQDINVMMQAYGQTDKNKNFNVCSGIVKASGVPGSRIVVSAACRHQLDNRNCATVRFASDAEPNTDVARVWGVAIVTGKEKEIMDLLNVGAFTALTAPYAAVPDGGGVFLLALVVLTGGWRHEGAELCSQTDGRDHLVKTNRHEHMGHPWIRQFDADERIHPQMRRDTGRAARQYPNRMESDTVPGIATDRRQHLQQGVLAAARDFRDPVRHVDHDAPARHTGTGGCDHTCHRPGLFRRRHRTILSGLGVAA